MEEVIQFTLMLGQLNDEETLQFISKSVQMNGRILIRKLFSTYFIHHSDSTEMKQFSEHITNIIDARINETNVEKSCDCIDKLPSALIGECASYLSLKEYVRFSRCNRQIFVSTNKPFKLYQLSQWELAQYPQRKSMNKFKCVKSLNIDFKCFNDKISHQNQTVWKNCALEKLMLWNYRDHYEAMLFFNKELMNFHQVKKLELVCFGDPKNERFDFDSFCEILCKFKGVKYLKMVYIYLTSGEFVADDLIQSLPNVICLEIQLSDESHFINGLMDVFGKQIESLYINDEDAITVDVNVPTHNFPKLKEFVAEHITNVNELTSFTNIATLQSAEIRTKEKKVLEYFIDLAIKKQKSIKQIRISTALPRFTDVLNKIKCALLNNKEIQRNTMMIVLLERYTYGGTGITRCDDILICMEAFKLLNTLNVLQFKEFMVQIQIKTSNFTETESKKIVHMYMSEFNKMTDIYSVHYSDNIFSICNKQWKKSRMWQRFNTCTF